MDFEALAVMVPMVRHGAVMLLVVNGVGLAWLHPNSSRDSAESSILDTDDITCLMMADSVKTARLLKFLLFLLVR